MRHSTTRYRSLLRTVISGVVVCLLLLPQLFSSLGSASGVTLTAGDASLVQTDPSAPCTTHDDRFPARQHHDMSRCCILHNDAKRQVPLFLAASFAIAIVFTPTTAVSVPRGSYEGDPGSAGLVGAWSSRAPPAHA